MKKTAKRISAAVISVFMCMAVPAAIAASGGAYMVSDAAENENKMTDTNKVSVIFTHDMHSHMDADKVVKDGRITEAGGFAKLKGAMNSVKEEYPESFVLDAGDFSMGTPYQTIYSAEASELKMMKYLGYDAATLGNHEFDYRTLGLASMLDAAARKGPQLVAANIDWDATLADSSLKNNAEILKKSFENYGIKDYTVIGSDGVKAAVFGIIGKSAVDYAPESGIIFRDAKEAAADVVDKIKNNEDVDVIICLSHCGTIEDENDKMEETEDYLLAKEVPDIDLIVSGHTHTKLEEPVQSGDTYIVSSGDYNTNMGHIVLERAGDNDKYKLSSYELIPLDETIEGDKGAASELDKYRKLVDKEYFNNYGYNLQDKIAENGIEFKDTDHFGVKQCEEPLGNIIADSYKYAVAKAENGEIKGYKDGGVAFGEVVSDKGGVQIAVVPNGVVRGSLIKGNITVADAFNISSLGYGKDGQAGYPLVRAYLTGKELRAAAEVDASVSNFMGVARLYSSGLEYSWNPNRLILNRAVDVVYNDGIEVRKLEDDKLYSVVADLYSCQMLGTVKDQSFGLLKIEPKDKEGKPITNFEDHIIYDGDKEVKAWYALASYIDSFEGNKIPEYYATTHNRKTEIDSKNPAELLKQPNNIAGIAVGVIGGLVLIVAGIVVLVRRRKKRSR